MAEHTRGCPYDGANIFSKLTFWWVNALFKLGQKNQLTEDNICDVSKEDESCKLESRVKRYWKDEMQKNSEDGSKPSLMKAVLLAFKWQWIPPGLIALAFETVKLIQPFLVGKLVRYFNNDEEAVSTATAYGIGAGLGISALLYVMLNPTYFFIMQHVALRMKVAVGALIYRKVLSLSSEAFHYTSAGQIVNHLSSDVEKFNEAIALLHFFWISPVTVTVIIYLLYRELGINCLWGLLVIFIIMPLQAGISTLFGKIRHRIGSLSDSRIQLMTEVLLSMRVIKMQCWEKPFQNIITSLRRSEISVLRRTKILEGVEKVLPELATRLALLAILLGLGSDAVSPGELFPVLAWLFALHGVLSRFPVQAVLTLKTFHSAACTIQTFLLLDEEKETIKDLRLHRTIQYCKEPHADWAIDIDHMTARWPLVYTEGRRRFQKKRQRGSTSSTKSLLRESDVDQAFSLKYISLNVKKGESIAVVGVVGSGKSSLLMSLIGELPHEIGQISINGRVSYCSQTHWIFSGTVRDNILFGCGFEPVRYKAVIEACGLSHDLQLLPKADQTYVGERGVQLSGGQKARISLARCIYHDGDVILLDDPLSAVDANVGRHIFQRCIVDLLAKKTVILVTHQLQYLKQVDRIVVLRDGSIHDVGDYEELKSRGTDMKALTSVMEHPGHASEAAIEAEEEEKQLLLQSASTDKQAISQAEDEDISSGSVALKVYWKYFCAGYGPWLLPILLPLWLAAAAFFCLSDWMLAEWLSQDSGDSPSDATAATTDVSQTSTRDWAHMPGTFRWYLIALSASTACHLLYAFSYLQMSITAGHRLHDRVLHTVIHATMRFFDIHPVGQILNRFARDLSFVDDLVPFYAYLVSVKTVQFLGFFLVTVIVNPWLTIALVPMILLIAFIRTYALCTLRQVKRLEAKARSPVYSHVSDTILGLETVRALGQQGAFLSQFDSFQDKHTSTWFLYLSSYRWMSVRSLIVITAYLNIMIYLSIWLKDSLDGNLLGLCLVYCISMGEPFEYYMRISADLESHMTSVERILGYLKLTQEPPLVSDKPPPPDWPSRGAITFTKTSLRYSSDAPLVLKEIDCHIQGKEKIGVVGRTGSGKSSLINALFRLVQPSGNIYVDTVNVGKLGLHDIRSKISVIPQEPMLFSQTLRWNLDPLEENSDERLWNALDQVHLKEKVNLMPNKLYTEIKEGGTNLSVGERQLLCLARAILKSRRILILDEATANVDQETDGIIQRTIRSRFTESTVITIAHRLYTVMDCDRIMVLSDGELKEFDTPYNLLQDSDGVFTKLVLSTGKNQAKQLQALAEVSQHKRTSAHIQLKRAMLLAHEQMVASTEDLTLGQAALNWNRFTHSQDSLDKAEVEHIVHKERRSVAPAQKIIHRKSPKRKDKRVVKEEEDEELLTYNSAPKARRQFRSSSQASNESSRSKHPCRVTADTKDDETSLTSLPSSDVGHSSVAKIPDSPIKEERNSHPRKEDYIEGRRKHRAEKEQMREFRLPYRAEVVETDIDFPINDSPQILNTDKNRSRPHGRYASQDEKGNISSIGEHASNEKDNLKRDEVQVVSPRSTRILKGPYVPLSQNDDFTEKFV